MVYDMPVANVFVSGLVWEALFLGLTVPVGSCRVGRVPFSAIGPCCVNVFVVLRVFVSTLISVVVSGTLRVRHGECVGLGFVRHMPAVFCWVMSGRALNLYVVPVLVFCEGVQKVD